VSTAQWRQVDLQTQLQTTRLDAEGADRRCFGIEQSIFAAPHTPRIRYSPISLFDAFLSAARSIPDIIECCFGTDKQMSWWIKTLPPDEQDRRNRFSKEFADTRQAFALLPLSNARRTSVHRRGYAPYEFKIAGRFGLTYAGSPTKSVPLSETPVITDPTFPPGIARASPIGPPHYTDFEIDGQPLFLSCHEYLNQAQALIAEGRKIAAAVHGANTLTPPPDA